MAARLTQANHCELNDALFPLVGSSREGRPVNTVYRNAADNG